MSVIRELRLLQTLVSSSGKTEEVTQGFDHVVGFNMKGLNRVESKLFFPWLKEKLDLIPDEGAKQAFQRVLKTATKQQEVLKEKAQDMVSSNREESSIQRPNSCSVLTNGIRRQPHLRLRPLRKTCHFL